MMEQVTVKELYNLEETIAKDIFDGVTYPWEVLPEIGDYIVEFGNSLPEEEYDKIGEDIWISKTAKATWSWIKGAASTVWTHMKKIGASFVNGVLSLVCFILQKRLEVKLQAVT